MKFVHAADIHLDSPLVGLERYESAPAEAARNAARRAFENLVRTAIEEEAAFVLIAGDLYDGDWKDYRTGLFFTERMAKLREAKVDVFIVAGNHDAASRLTKNLRPPDNVRFLPVKKPGTVVLDAFGVAIHGQGFATQAVTDDLAASYPAPVPGMFNIGLLHSSLDGREGHASYAPTTAPALIRKGYDYWALGHVHRREIVSTDPWIVFPGNLQGRHARETGPKGCTLVAVDDGRAASVEERRLDVMRWSLCRADASEARTGSGMLDAVLKALNSEAGGADGRTLAARVEVSAPEACRADIAADPNRWVNEIRSLASSVAAADVWIEKVGFHFVRPSGPAVPGPEDSAAADLLGALESPPGPDETAAVLGALEGIRSVLPPELLSGESAANPADPALLPRIIAEARGLLRARISRGEADA